MEERGGSSHTKRQLSKTVPALENKISKLGKLVFLPRKLSFPPLERSLSSRGKLRPLPWEGALPHRKKELPAGETPSIWLMLFLFVELDETVVELGVAP